MDAAIEFLNVFEPHLFGVGLDEALHSGAQDVERGGQAGDECFSEFGLRCGIRLFAGRGRFGRRRAFSFPPGMRNRLAGTDGAVHQIQQHLGRTVDFGNAFRRAGLPRLLNQVGRVGVGKNDDRQFGKFRFAANFLDDFEARHFGQHEVKHDGIGLERAHQLQPAFAVERGLGLIAFHGEFVSINIRHDLVVFDDEDFFHGSEGPDWRFRSFGRLQFAAQDVDERLDGEFDVEKRLGDEVVAAGHPGTGAVVKVAEDGDKDDGGFLVRRQAAQLGAKFDSRSCPACPRRETPGRTVFRKAV